MWSFRSFHSPFLCRIEMVATSTREVEARSAACVIGGQRRARPPRVDARAHVTGELLECEELVDAFLHLASLQRDRQLMPSVNHTSNAIVPRQGTPRRG